MDHTMEEIQIKRISVKLQEKKNVRKSVQALG